MCWFCLFVIFLKVLLVWVSVFLNVIYLSSVYFIWVGYLVILVNVILLFKMFLLFGMVLWEDIILVKVLMMFSVCGMCCLIICLVSIEVVVWLIE